MKRAGTLDRRTPKLPTFRNDQPHSESVRSEVDQETELVVAADTPSGELPGLPAGATPIFQGRPPLALNAATNNLTAPHRILQNELVRDRYFYTLPGNLWDEVVQQVGEGVFDPEAARLEDELGSICGDHSANAGLWRGCAFAYSQLHRPAPFSISAAAAGWGLNQAEIDNRLRVLAERGAGIAGSTRGYLGWLSLQRRFVEEHDDLLRAHVSVVTRWGTAAFGLPVPPVGFDQASSAEQAAFRAADEPFVDFFCRWRLQGLAAPYLPVPLQPLMAGNLPEIVLARYLRTGGLFVVPDTFPVPSRDEFRGMLDDALHGSPPGHLREWMEIISADNTAKQAIPRFSRMFQLQHYWRVLQHRHRRALHRRATPLKQAFASFLRIGVQTIHNDLIEIRRCLAADWAERSAGFPFGPF